MKKRFVSIIAAVIAIVTVLTGIPFSVTAADDVELLGEVQGSMPKLVITVDSGYSLDTIHASKDEKIKAHVQIKNAWDSSFNMSSTAIEMKTRGNSTFNYMKKPYQIKFDSKTDMFGMGAAKKWVLLANYVDGSFIRNKIVFDIAEEMGMPYVCKSVFVNLYINGNYIGVYQLIEKVEIGDSRVPLKNDLGVMVEMESAKRVAEEDFWFTTSVSGKPFVYKEYNTDFEDAPASEVAAVRSYLEERINTIEDELYNNGKDWEKLSSLIDVDSFVQFYLINELAMNVDATLASTYFYIDGPDDVLHMGPLWDYDRAFGSYDYEGSGYEQDTSADFMKNITDCSDQYRVEWFKMLFQYPEFVERVNELYDEYADTAFNSERINATIDAYQDRLNSSLMNNYVSEGWALFHNISEAEFFTNTTDANAYLKYTVDYIKSNIASRIAYMDTAYGKYVPALFYQQNNGRIYSGGSMTDSQVMTSLSLSLDGVIDGSVSYSIQGSGVSVAGAKDGDAVKARGIYRVAVSLEGNVANYYSVQYRVYSNGSWSSWSADGADAGVGGRFNIERIQARLIEKSAPVEATVSFDVEGVEPVTTIAGNKITLPPLPDGIEGWYLDEEFATEPVTEITVGAGATVVYGKKIANEIISGDFDGNGEVNAMDVNIAKRIAAGSVTPTEVQLLAGDLNGDGTVNGIDSNILARVIAGTN
ncbi:MAG: hypothetical protein E7647_04065 [Ruminococcaceae bacterium]|nr:hypothetical protein [Oscillospiraceae bacterium]